MRAAAPPFLWGMAAAIVCLLGARLVVERTSLVDVLVRPLTLPDTTGQADVIVVLGAGVTQLCTPNAYGMHRMLLAARLFDQKRAPLMLLTGGRAAGSACSTAESMRDLAVRLGVPLDRIRLEQTSNSTWQNALRSSAVLAVIGARRILLITDKAHLSRADASFRKFGFEIERAAVPIALGHANNTSLLWMGLRSARPGDTIGRGDMSGGRWRRHLSSRQSARRLTRRRPEGWARTVTARS